jgi:hypothetical protein
MYHVIRDIQGSLRYKEQAHVEDKPQLVELLNSPEYRQCDTVYVKHDDTVVVYTPATNEWDTLTGAKLDFVSSIFRLAPLRDNPQPIHNPQHSGLWAVPGATPKPC